MNESALFNLIKVTFEAPAFAVLRGVTDATGARHSRQADAIAMGVWPSRGLYLHGFEIKSDRRDWLRELKDPAKAEPIARYCDRWWLVAADETMVKDEELPPKWGLLVPAKKGVGLCFKKTAEPLEPVALSREFLAALLRRMNEQAPDIDALKAERKLGFDEGVESSAKAAKWKVDSAVGELERLRHGLADFEKRSGIRISEYNGASIGEAVRVTQQIITNRDRMVRDAKDWTGRMREFERHLEIFAKEIATLGLVGEGSVS